MINKIANYLYDKRFKMTVYNDSVYLVNFNRIISIEDNYLSLYSDSNKIIITGNNLVIKKILKDELLVIGRILKIEVINEQ